jgi:hypothetical protein
MKVRRKAFRGPLALRLTLATTEKTPPHSHNIAKNLLDLFAKPRPSLPTRRRSLLYADDSQVHALAVTCHHGEATPRIFAVARPLGTLLADLDLAVQSERDRRDNHHEWERSSDLKRAVDDMQNMLRDEAHLRQRLGDRLFEAMLRFSRRNAQECLLGRAAVTPFDLAQMYNVSGRGFGMDLAAIWEQAFASTPLRIRLTELPQVEATATVWKEEIEAKLRGFQTQFGWLVDPLVMPVALQAVIKPPPPSRQNGLHDLDNVLRTYLIPRVVDILKPVSHYVFTLDEQAMKESPDALRVAGKSFRLPKRPASTKCGVTRYEAWRLPPAHEGSEGFVSVAIVADLTGHGDTFRQIDDEVERWLESLDSRQ